MKQIFYSPDFWLAVISLLIAVQTMIMVASGYQHFNKWDLIPAYILMGVAIIGAAHLCLKTAGNKKK